MLKSFIADGSQRVAGRRSTRVTRAIRWVALKSKAGVRVRPRARDLFGDVAITKEELERYVLAVSGLQAGSARFNYYVQHWNVLNKIASLKLSGKFERVCGELAAFRSNA